MRDSIELRCCRRQDRRQASLTRAALIWVRITIPAIKKSPTTDVVGDFLAEDEGFEPPQTESESGVLPLHKSSIARTFIIIHKRGKKSRGFSKILFFLSPVRITTFLRFIPSIQETAFLSGLPAPASGMSPARPCPGAWSGYIPAAFWYWDASAPVPGCP